MSVEITLYAKKSSKTSLLNFLKKEGFIVCKHIVESLNTPDNIHLMWFEKTDFESRTGVEATIYKISANEKKIYNCSDWILHTRTRSSGTYEDKAKQNLVIKKARKLFKGSFHNDWYGTNRYTSLDDYKKLSPLDKGLSIVFNNANQKLDMISSCVEEHKNSISESINNTPNIVLKSLLKTNDSSILLYNSLMPFLVSIIEYFYGQSFMLFLRYNQDARMKLADENIKIKLSDVLNIINGESTLEQYIDQSYNFQNIDSINKAYKKYLSIDLMSILSTRKRVRNKTLMILSNVKEILEARHKFTHRLELNYDLTKDDYLTCISCIEKAIKITSEEFKKKGVEFEEVQ